MLYYGAGWGSSWARPDGSVLLCVLRETMIAVDHLNKAQPDHTALTCTVCTTCYMYRMYRAITQVNNNNNNNNRRLVTQVERLQFRPMHGAPSPHMDGHRHA